MFNITLTFNPLNINRVNYKNYIILRSKTDNTTFDLFGEFDNTIPKELLVNVYGIKKYNTNQIETNIDKIKQVLLTCDVVFVSKIK